MVWFRRLLWVVDHPAIGVYGSPVLLVLGIAAAYYGPEWWEDWFLDRGMWMLFTFWAGSGFAFMWWMIRKEAVSLPGGELTAAGVGIGAVILVAGTGVFTDLELFGMTIWPGLMLASRAIATRLNGGRVVGDEEKTA